MKLEGISAIVTGAASGLGAATAASLAASGVHVVGIDLAIAVERAVSASTAVRLVAADVTSDADVSAALASLPAEIPLRLCVNCAGIAPPSRILGTDGAHDLSLFRKVIEVNLVGTFNVLRLAAKTMSETSPDPNGQRGVIVNTASIAAYEGQIGQAAYAASKGGVVSLTLAAARDLARTGIRVNTIAPGIVHTAMLDSLDDDAVRRLGEGVPFPRRTALPAEYAQLVTMIAEHDYLNGETIRMDGALRMAPR
ncbi:MAG TPA: SDR family NAD(P)-dependent oxidoreductase [Galbitalea sp.]|jgi:NAD(P)-dependent dehydrogenase (short-subunit alcohol dehydrogenase family)|nr:SDR family NAD(P)-dependent oxidoreductase [Galbitalea sp.]